MAERTASFAGLFMAEPSFIDRPADRPSFSSFAR
jgi:hypothetical protein